MFISVGSASPAGRTKLKIKIYHEGTPTSVTTRKLLIDSVDAIVWRAQGVVAVDRGCFDVSIWVSELPARVTGPDGGDGERPDHDDQHPMKDSRYVDIHLLIPKATVTVLATPVLTHGKAELTHGQAVVISPSHQVGTPPSAEREVREAYWSGNVRLGALTHYEVRP